MAVEMKKLLKAKGIRLKMLPSVHRSNWMCIQMMFFNKTRLEERFLIIYLRLDRLFVCKRLLLTFVVRILQMWLLLFNTNY